MMKLDFLLIAILFVQMITAAQVEVKGKTQSSIGLANEDGSSFMLIERDQTNLCVYDPLT